MIKKAFGDDSLSEAHIKVWYRRFKDGWESMESGPHSGRPSTSKTPENVECVWAAINENQWLTVRDWEEALGIPQTIIKEYYIEVLRRLRDALKRKWPRLWASGDWQLHHDNAPALSTVLVQVFFRLSITSPGSVTPPSAPIWFPANSGSPKLKSPLEGRRPVFEIFKMVGYFRDNPYKLKYHLSWAVCGIQTPASWKRVITVNIFR